MRRRYTVCRQPAAIYAGSKADLGSGGDLAGKCCRTKKISQRRCCRQPSPRPPWNMQVFSSSSRPLREKVHRRRRRRQSHVRSGKLQVFAGCSRPKGSKRRHAKRQGSQRRKAASGARQPAARAAGGANCSHQQQPAQRLRGPLFTRTGRRTGSSSHVRSGKLQGRQRPRAERQGRQPRQARLQAAPSGARQPAARAAGGAKLQPEQSARAASGRAAGAGSQRREQPAAQNCSPSSRREHQRWRSTTLSRSRRCPKFEGCRRSRRCPKFSRSPARSTGRIATVRSSSACLSG